MVRNFVEADDTSVAALVERAYGRSYEAWLIRALRKNNDIAIEYVLEKEDHIIGHISFAAHKSPYGWWSLCTVAVAEEERNQGFGSQLVRQGLEFARQSEACAITVLGSAAFYQRFGFTRNAARNLDTPFSLENTLLNPIKPHVAGRKAVLEYPRAFSRL
ncbi:MAG: N-acetyltransferase [Thalassovita sp.]